MARRFLQNKLISGKEYLQPFAKKKKKKKKEKEKQTKKWNLRYQNFQKYFAQAILYGKFREQRAVSVDPDEVAHDEPPQMDLLCLQIDEFHFAALRVNLIV